MPPVWPCETPPNPRSRMSLGFGSRDMPVGTPLHPCPFSRKGTRFDVRPEEAVRFQHPARRNASIGGAVLFEGAPPRSGSGTRVRSGARSRPATIWRSRRHRPQAGRGSSLPVHRSSSPPTSRRSSRRCPRQRWGRHRPQAGCRPDHIGVPHAAARTSTGAPNRSSTTSMSATMSANSSIAAWSFSQNAPWSIWSP